MAPLYLSLIALAVAADSVPVADFKLRDTRGVTWQLGEQHGKVVVLVFLGCDCPLAKLYANRLSEMAHRYTSRDVVFAGINANNHDSLSDVAIYARKHALSFPLLKDVGNCVADQMGALHTPEVLLLDRAHIVRYRGRIDDQYTPAVHRGQATRHDLLIALEELLTGKPISISVTEAEGCTIGRMPPPDPQATVTYTRDIASILNRHCLVCHRPGQIAPFSLTSYQDASGWAETIRQVIAKGQMPPWSADPAYGRFANDPSLTRDEKRLIAQWVRTGCREGDLADLPPPPSFPEDWTLGTPDLVLSMPESFTVPAEGVIEYQSFVVDPGFKEDTWIQAAEIQPGNRAVVHHCNIYLQPPGTDAVFEQGRIGSHCLAAQALGTPPLRLPPGAAKLVPAGWRLVFVIHYTPVGTVQVDRTRLGLWLAAPGTVRREVASKLMFEPDLSIPPRVKEHVLTQTWALQDDLLLFGMFPHMHLRGKSFRYEVVLPDSSVEILLDVPRFDFNWQHRYDLVEPKLLPRGSLIRCTAVYDNSSGNPANPNPDAMVLAGPQSWDEMFNGFWEVALADQDLTRPTSRLEVVARSVRGLFQAGPAATLVAGAALAMLIRRRTL